MNPLKTVSNLLSCMTMLKILKLFVVILKPAERGSIFRAETESPQLVRAVFLHQLDLFFCISRACFSTPENHRNLVPESLTTDEDHIAGLQSLNYLVFSKIGKVLLFPLGLASFTESSLFIGSFSPCKI